MLKIAQSVHTALKSSIYYFSRTLNQSKASRASSEKIYVSSKLYGDALTVATQLDGRTLHVPDLTNVFAAWPTATNKHVKELEALMDNLLERIVTNEKKLNALKQADFTRLISLLVLFNQAHLGLLTSTRWYPDAEWPELKVATAYSVWILVWDDEIDAGDTDTASDEHLVQEYYGQSLAYIHRVLGLDKDSADDIDAPHQNMALFEDVGCRLRETTDTQQRQRFFDKLENFMLQVGAEHTHRMAGTIPSLAEYMNIRAGSVGCAPQIAITELVFASILSMQG
jgi:hypothetical protein